MLAKYNKQTRDEKRIIRNFDFKYDTAYHMDAQLFGQYLKEKIALPNGVEHIIGDVHSHKKDHLGNITDIMLTDARVFKSDLWIDCTGFKSILLEGWMGSEFRPFEKMLANDKAMACRIPYEDREKEMHNVTDCHALGNGWVWNIPLWNRIGTGYVYSSRFCTKEEAEKEFRQHLATIGSKERAENAEMMHIEIRHGRRRRAWLANVVGVGLSYGFVEPLESTGLLTTHENIIKLVETLNRREGFVTRSEVEGFNLSVETEVCRFRDFVALHYALSQRTDTPYWRWCTELNEYCPDQMGDHMLLHAMFPNLLGNIVGAQIYQDGLTGATFIAAGMGVKAISTKELIFYGGNRMDPIAKEQEIGFTKRSYEDYKEFIVDYVKTLPSHYEFLKQNIYGGKDDHIL
jgi:tryptophan halogenase